MVRPTLLLAALLCAAAAAQDAGPHIATEGSTLTLAAVDVCFSTGQASRDGCLDSVVRTADLSSAVSQLEGSMAVASAAASIATVSMAVERSSLSAALSIASRDIDANSDSIEAVAGDLSSTDELLNEVSAHASTVNTAASANAAQLETLSQMVVSLKAATSAADTALGGNLASLQTATSSLETALRGYADELHELAINHAESHVTAVVSDYAETLEADQSGQLESIEARFGELESMAQEDVYEYSFSGNSAINTRFWYELSVDHYKPGSLDSQHVGNWWIDVEAHSGHCGGGCHVTHYHEKLYLNGYCTQDRMEGLVQTLIGGGGGTWAFSRRADSYNGHGYTCNIVRIEHQPGPYGFGGPYWVKIKSSKPLVVNHAYKGSAQSSCQISCGGPECGNGACAAWSCKVTNCPNHLIQPQACASPYSRTYLSNGAENYGGKCRIF